MGIMAVVAGLAIAYPLYPAFRGDPYYVRGRVSQAVEFGMEALGEDAALAQQRDARGVIPPVFEPFEAFKKNLSDIPAFTGIPNNTAHFDSLPGRPAEDRFTQRDDMSMSPAFPARLSAISLETASAITLTTGSVLDLLRCIQPSSMSIFIPSRSLNSP